MKTIHVPQWMGVRTVVIYGGPPRYGPLFGKGRDAAVVSVVCANTGGTGDGQFLFADVVYRIERNRPVPIAILTPRAQMRSSSHVTLQELSSIRTGELSTREAIYGPNDSTCCSSGSARTTWFFRAGRFISRTTAIEPPFKAPGLAHSRFPVADVVIRDYVGIATEAGIGGPVPLVRGMAWATAQRLGVVYHVRWAPVFVPEPAPRGIVAAQGVGFGDQLAVSTGPLSNPWESLPETTVPPVTRECDLPLEQNVDGNAYPLVCGNHVNVAAWDYFAPSKGTAAILGLGRGATVCGVVRALKSDSSYGGNLTPNTMVSVLEMADVYYGWHIGDGLVAQIDQGGSLMSPSVPPQDRCTYG